MFKIILLCVAAIILAACAPGTNGDSRVGTPLNVSYDGKSMIINGDRILFIAGAIHYPRSSAGMWDSLMKTAVANGINLIQTYVFWQLHEPVKGQYYFDDNADLIAFLKAAMNNGLFVNLRIGPYVCGEWTFGGIPGWVKNIPGIRFRDYNQPWMTEMQTFVTYIVNLMKANKMFGPQGGPIVMAQIENEYGWIEKQYNTTGRQYALWSASMANGLNIGVPWIMCAQGDIDTVINTCNGFYCDSFVYGLSQTYPKQPPMWTENWSGWFQNYGDPKPSRPAEDLAVSVALWYARGGTYMAYYMFYGGSNLGRAAGINIIQSYEYDAPVNEYGHPNEPKYSHLGKMHAILNRYSKSILNSPQQYGPYGTNQQAYTYGTGTEAITFLLNTDNVNSVTLSFGGVSYTLPKWSATILGGGKFLYNTAQIDASIIVNPKTMTTIQKLPVTGYWIDTAGVWGTGITTAGAPDQVSVSNDVNDYLWYTTYLSLGKWDSRYIHLSYVNAKVTILANGIPIYNGDTQSGYLPSSDTFSSGPVQFLVSSFGLQDYSTGMEQYQTGILGDVYVGPTNLYTTARNWTQQIGLYGQYKMVYDSTGYNSVTWKSDWQNVVNRPITWFSFKFDLSASSTTGYALDLIGLYKGLLYVNGHLIGRYYNKTGQGNCVDCNYAKYSSSTCRTNCGEASQRYFHIPADWLKAQGNLVTVFEEFGGDPSRVALVMPTPSASSATPAPSTPLPATQAPPTPRPPTASPPTASPPTASPPTASPPTASPPTASPPTALPPTVAPTVKPATSPPATPVPATPKPPTSPPATPVPPASGSSGNIKVAFLGGSSANWVAISVTGDDGVTNKVELHDAGAYSAWLLTQKTDWASFVFQPSSGALTSPVSLRLTSTSGAQVVLDKVLTSFTSTAAVATGQGYGSAGSSTPAPSTPALSTPTPSTPAPSTPAPSTPASSTPAPSTPAPSGNTVKLTIQSGSNAYWLAISFAGNKDTASVSLKDNVNIKTASPFTSTNWGAWTYSPAGFGLATPTTVYATSTSGTTVTFTLSAFTPGLVVDSGAAY